MGKTSNRIITKPIWILSLVSLFTDVASEMLYPVMPLYLKSIGFSIVLIGVLEGAAEAVAGLSKGYFGQKSDQLRRRVPFIKIGYGLSAFAKPLMALFTFPLWIFFLRTTERLGKGIRTSARDAYLSDQTTKEHKARVFGFHRSMDTLGAAIGPVMALVLLYYLPGQYKFLFVLSFVPGIIALALTHLLKEDQKKTTVHKKNLSFLSFLTYWKTATPGYKYLVVGLLAFAVFNSSDVFLLLALKEKGYSDTQMIMFYIFYNLVYALFSYPIGILADKIGLKKTLFIGLFLFFVMYTFFGFASGTIFIGSLFLVYGLYASATEGISKALITNISTPDQTATAIGFYNSFLSICALLASTIGGFIWYTFSPTAMFVFSGIGAFFVLCYLLWVFKFKPSVVKM